MARVVLVAVLVLGLVCLARAKTDAPAKPVVPRLPPTCDQILPGKVCAHASLGRVRTRTCACTCARVRVYVHMYVYVYVYVYVCV